MFDVVATFAIYGLFALSLGGSLVLILAGVYDTDLRGGRSKTPLDTCPNPASPSSLFSSELVAEALSAAGINVETVPDVTPEDLLRFGHSALCPLSSLGIIRLPSGRLVVYRNRSN